MKRLIINLLLLFSTRVWSQTDHGIRFVSIDFEDHVVVGFFNHGSMNSWNFQEALVYLRPEAIFFITNLWCIDPVHLTNSNNSTTTSASNLTKSGINDKEAIWQG
jgi:hypothetical protein